jgi:hypothetical protein
LLFAVKRAYSNKISSLAQYSSKHIRKEAFLLAFKAAFERLITKENICVSFRGAGLILHNLEAVLLKLNVVLRTLTLPKPEDTLYKSKPLSNLLKLEA